MKKYDKTAGWKASKLFVSSKLNPTYFMSSTILDDLFKETEDLFIEKFEGGRRRRGMAKLRIPDSRRQASLLSTFHGLGDSSGSRHRLHEIPLADIHAFFFFLFCEYSLITLSARGLVFIWA